MRLWIIQWTFKKVSKGNPGSTLWQQLYGICITCISNLKHLCNSIFFLWQIDCCGSCNEPLKKFPRVTQGVLYDNSCICITCISNLKHLRNSFFFFYVMANWLPYHRYVTEYFIIDWTNQRGCKKERKCIMCNKKHGIYCPYLIVFLNF